MDVSFTPYQDNDYNDLKKMILCLYDEDPEGEPISEEKIDKTIREYQRNPQKINIYILKTNGVKIGYAILVYFWSNEHGGNILVIDELYVAENYRGQGAATEFMHFLEHMENKVALQLETTPSNQRAADYYKRLGFMQSKNSHLMKPTV